MSWYIIHIISDGTYKLMSDTEIKKMKEHEFITIKEFDKDQNYNEIHKEYIDFLEIIFSPII